MLLGISQFHQKQGVPYNFSKDSELYPNDLSSKLSWQGFKDSTGVPRNKLSDGKYVYFPIAIAQKAIALYENNNVEEFLLLADWFVNSVDRNGGYDCWSSSNKDTITNYSSMAQGQALSVLYRAYKETNEEKYLSTANLVYSCLMNEHNNISIHTKNGIVFDETPKKNRAIILNGWIFTLWGIFDYEKMVTVENKDNSFASLSEFLAEELDNFNCGYWSLYSDDAYISSPFYHNLHIAQLQSMYILTGIDKYKNHAELYISYNNN
ncbi:hypothetical protein BCU91_19590, partial [Shewanella sp. 10N.286.52.B9]